MTGMFNYIFDSMKNTEVALRKINKTLKLQRSFNRNVAVLAVATTAYIVVTENKINNLTKKIKQLEKVDKETNNAKGE